MYAFRKGNSADFIIFAFSGAVLQMTSLLYKVLLSGQLKGKLLLCLQQVQHGVLFVLDSAIISFFTSFSLFPGDDTYTCRLSVILSQRAVNTYKTNSVYMRLFDFTAASAMYRAAAIKGLCVLTQSCRFYFFFAFMICEAMLVT